jgi:hypothetical protein
MTEEVPESEKETAAKPSIMRPYARRAPPSSLTPAQEKRQTDVLRAACEHLVPSGAAIAFLNAYNKTLGGAPLQLALQSDDGLLRVEQHLASQGKKGRSDGNATGPGRS